MFKNRVQLVGNIIYQYSRQQALSDGMLVDVSSTAREAGFTIPVAVTEAVWSRYIDWSEEDTQRQTIQDCTGRLWDVLWMLRLSIKHHTTAAILSYRLSVVPRDGKSRKATLTTLKSIISGGDNGEPVITIMLPDED